MFEEMKPGAYEGRSFLRDDADEHVAECGGVRYVEVEVEALPDERFPSYCAELRGR